LCLLPSAGDSKVVEQPFGLLDSLYEEDGRFSVLRRATDDELEAAQARAQAREGERVRRVLVERMLASVAKRLEAEKKKAELAKQTRDPILCKNVAIKIEDAVEEHESSGPRSKKTIKAKGGEPVHGTVDGLRFYRLGYTFRVSLIALADFPPGVEGQGVRKGGVLRYSDLNKLADDLPKIGPGLDQSVGLVQNARVKVVPPPESPEQKKRNGVWIAPDIWALNEGPPENIAGFNGMARGPRRHLMREYIDDKLVQYKDIPGIQAKERDPGEFQGDYDDIRSIEGQFTVKVKGCPKTGPRLAWGFTWTRSGGKLVLATTRQLPYVQKPKGP